MNRLEPVQPLRPSLLALQERFGTSQSLIGIEVGVADGRNAASMLAHLPNLSRLYLVDPYQEYPQYKDYKQDELDHFLADAQERIRSLGSVLSEKTVWVRKQFGELAMEELRHGDFGNVDFVYIDGNHQQWYVEADLKQAFALIRGNGMVAGDDWPLPGVQNALRKFQRSHGCTVEAVAHDVGQYDWWIWRDGSGW